MSVVEAAGKHTSTLIFLHGCGDRAHRWADIFRYIAPNHMKILCPTSKTVTTLKSGKKIPAWIDVKSFPINMMGREDRLSIRNSTVEVHKMLKNEIEQGIDSNRLILGGFGVGGAMSLFAGLTFCDHLGGLLSLNGWLPMYRTFPGFKKLSVETPILLCHGANDHINPLNLGLKTARILKSFMLHTELIEYDSVGLVHSSNEQEMIDIKHFINYVAPDKD